MNGERADAGSYPSDVITPAAVRMRCEHSQSLSRQRFAPGVSTEVDVPFSLRVPEDNERHASNTMVEMDDPASMVQELASRNIILDFRPGAVRISPYFYNTTDDIESIVSAMCEIRDAG